MVSIPPLYNFTTTEIREFCNNMIRQIRPILPDIPNYNVCQIAYYYNSGVSAFITMMAHLERLFDMDHLEDMPFTRNSLMYRSNIYDVLRNIEKGAEQPDIPQFRVHISPKTRYSESEISRTGLRHLEAAEVALKDEKNQFLKIFTYHHTLVVYSNKEISLQTMIKLKVLQWNLFKDAIRTPQDDVLTLLQALQEEVGAVVNRTAHKILNLEILNKIRYLELKELFRPNYKKRIEMLQRDRDDYNKMIQRYENDLMSAVTNLQRVEEELFMFETKEEEQEDNTPLIKYLINHPYIKEITKASSSAVYLYYEAPLLYFDDYVIKKLLPHKKGDEQTILKIFLDNKYELMTRCKLCFSPGTFTVKTEYIGHDEFIGHPHIDRFNCFGNHRTALKEAAQAGNYFGAIDQLSQAVLNINFTDTAVVNEMLRTLIALSNKKTWRSKETQVLLSTDELLEIYNE